jgi:hypothetical protein
LLHDRPARTAAALALTGWLVAALGQGYWTLRQLVRGLDVIAVSLVLFAVAVLISLGKAGVLPRWAAERQPAAQADGAGAPPHSICCEGDPVQADSAPQQSPAGVSGTG